MGTGVVLLDEVCQYEEWALKSSVIKLHNLRHTVASAACESRCGTLRPSPAPCLPGGHHEDNELSLRNCKPFLISFFFY